MSKSDTKHQTKKSKAKDIRQFFQVMKINKKNVDTICQSKSSSNLLPLDNEKIIDLNEQNIECPICLSIFKNPMTLSCKYL